jgi:hypothetical protein
LLSGGWLAFDRLYARGGDESVAWSDVTPARPVRFARPVERVFETGAELREVFPRPPAIDFRRRRAFLVAVGPRSSSGYEVAITDVHAERRRVVVTVREVAPSLRQAVRPRVTYPFRLITLPRDDRPVEVER